MAAQTGRQPTWVFLSNHAHVLLCIARDPDSRALDIAQQVGITERAAHRIISDLVAEGYVKRIKMGRRNRYEVNRQGHLRSASFRHLKIGPLLDLLGVKHVAPAHRPPKPYGAGAESEPIR